MKRFNAVYEVGVIVLAVISVVMAIADLSGAAVASLPWFVPLDYAILIIFGIDYVVRLIRSEKKGAFIKSNIFDLIAIIPFNALFSFFRFFRIFRILRVAKIAKLAKLARFIGAGGRFKNKASKFLHMNGLIYVIYLNFACVLIGAICIYFLEKGLTIQTFGDAVWWAFVTATTVGYGDISPSTTAGRGVAAVLMICGIGLISMLTGTVATYFTSKINQTEKEVQLSELKDVASSLSVEEISLLVSHAKERIKK